jgi:hypothetical protein
MHRSDGAFLQCVYGEVSRRGKGLAACVAECAERPLDVEKALPHA